MRRAFQLFFLALFAYLISATIWPVSDSVLVDAFLTIDPLLSLQAVLASRDWVTAAWYGLLIFGLALVLGRFFCGWICPFGTCLEISDDLVFGKNKKRIWKNRVRKLRNVKYGILIVILFGAVFGQGLAFIADPIVWCTRLFIYSIWPVYASIQNLLLDGGRPFFEYFGWMNLARASVSQPVFDSFGVFTLMFFAFLVWLGRYQKRFWCRVLCPLGALLAVPSRFALFHRRVGEGCDDDGICARVCQTGAIGDRFCEYDPMECVQCGSCVSICRKEVTSFVPTIKNEGRAPSFDLSRRQTLGILALGSMFSAWSAFNPNRRLIGDYSLRPPGALPEDDFLAKCVRCGQCIKVCPTHCLQPSTSETGITGIMSPIAMMRLGPCDQNCNACGHVCPTDAIHELDLDEKQYAKIGNAVIIPGRCIVWEQDKICLVCDEHCPYGAIYWREVESGGNRRPFVDENRCNGCGQCEVSCPVEGISAIRIYPAGQIRLTDKSYIEVAKERGLILKPKENEFMGYPAGGEGYFGEDEDGT